MRAMGFNISALTVTIFNSQNTNTAERSMCHTPVIRLCREIIVEENGCACGCVSPTLLVVESWTEFTFTIDR